MPDISTVRGHLVAELRRLRSMAQVNQRQVAEDLDWSPTKIHRIEKGDVSISVTDLRALLGYYGITDRMTLTNLVEMAKVTRRRPPPFSAYRDVMPPDAIRYLGYEEAASSVVEVQSRTVPGLLQTEDFARAWLGGVNGADPDRIERLLASRLDRQRLLTAPHAPRLSFLLDEAVLHRPVGGPEVMRAQLRWLGQVADLPTVDIRIVPLSVGAHPGLRGSFSLLTLPGREDPDVVYVEGRRGDSLFRDDPAVVDVHRSTVEQLRSLAAEPHMLPLYVQSAVDWLNLSTR
jgi:transcriptional regulator with XRE-family HTH domain